jgi:hypothetical protein
MLFECLVHAQDLVENRLHALSDRYRNGKETHPDPETFQGNSGPGISAIDEKPVGSMSKADLIKEIRRLDSGYTLQFLDSLTVDKLVVLFDQL